MTGNDPLIGKQLGDYEIQSMLGQGGMARVYKGYDDRLDRYAAVKVIEPNLTSVEEDEEYRERFQREARAIARLNHPRVVGVYQFNSVDNLYYMAMVFVEGQDLRHILKQYIKRGERLSHKQILQIIRDIAEALDYSHKQGVIHRDVKPSNIMIQEDGHAVLTDFGLALNAQEGTIGNTFGSVHYIAPEQAMSSAQAVAQSDLYSLGVVLYEMLVGRVPFEDVSAMTVALQHISDPPPPPRTINPDIPQTVEDVVIKVLDKDPLKRYKSGQAFIYALEAAFAASDDEDTHDLEHPDSAKSTDDGAHKLEQTRPREDAQSDPAPIIMSPLSADDNARPEDNVATISDSSKARPGSLPFSPVEDDRAKAEKSSRSGVIMGVVAVVIVLAMIAGVVLFTGGGDGDDADATTTAQAVAALAETEQANDDSTATADAEANAESSETAQASAGLAETEQANDDATATAEAEVNAEATETAQAIISMTETAEMVTNTPTNTNTPEPTDTEDATNTPEASNTPTTTPTNTATVTPSPTPTPEGTPTYSSAINTQGDDDPAEILLRYTGETIVLYNRSSRRINISGLSFVRLSDNTTFRASEWNTSDNNLNAMRSRMCYQGLTTMFLDWDASDAPADMCLFRQGIRQTVRSFWTSRNLSEGDMFAVRLNGETLAECPVTAFNSEDEVYCLVDIDLPEDDD